MWLLDKLRGSVEGCRAKKTQSSASSSSNQEPEGVPVFVYANVLTPAKIPDFFIPPKLICCPPAGLEPEPEPLLLLTPEPRRRGGLRPSASEQALCPSRSPKGAPRGNKSPLFSRSLVKSANRHIIQIESVDNPADAPGGGGASSLQANTNADPQSQTAMSLPYVPKAQTSYGFSTLVESPHTRRKESLFHSDPGTSPLTSPNSQRRTGTATATTATTSQHLAPADSPYRYFSGGESDTCSSAESSPFTSPLLSRSACILRSISQETQAKVSRAKRSLARHSSLSTDDTCSSADNSPNVQRRRLRCSPSFAPFRSGKAGACSSPSGGRGGSSDLLQRAHTVNLRKGGRGTLRLSTHYDAEASRLRVRVLAAQDLYDRATDVKSINCCVALYLNPGKQQKQRSNIIKNSRHPVFDEDFFFDAVPRAQLRDLALKMKVLNKGTSLKRDVLLGEREVLLSELVLG